MALLWLYLKQAVSILERRKGDFKTVVKQEHTQLHLLGSWCNFPWLLMGNTSVTVVGFLWAHFCIGKDSPFINFYFFLSRMLSRGPCWREGKPCAVLWRGIQFSYLDLVLLPSLFVSVTLESSWEGTKLFWLKKEKKKQKQTTNVPRIVWILKSVCNQQFCVYLKW